MFVMNEQARKRKPVFVASGKEVNGFRDNQTGDARANV